MKVQSLLMATFVLACLQACQIIQEVPEGGAISSKSGDRDCAEGRTCVIDVEKGSTFSDTFTAVPKSGYVFTGWRKSDNYLCGGSSEPCVLENVPSAMTANDVGLMLAPTFEQAGYACIALYDPVCAKQSTGIVCITEPCPVAEYRSFSNSCYADAEQADIAINGSCFLESSGLESISASNLFTPASIVDELPGSDRAPTLIAAKLNDNALEVTLGYSGCGPTDFSMNVHSAFMESYPVQASVEFTPHIESDCLAYFETAFVFDLLPIHLAYQKQYPGSETIVILPGIGEYRYVQEF